MLSPSLFVIKISCGKCRKEQPLHLKHRKTSSNKFTRLLTSPSLGPETAVLSAPDCWFLSYAVLGMNYEYLLCYFCLFISVGVFFVSTKHRAGCSSVNTGLYCIHNEALWNVLGLLCPERSLCCET